jgi:LDH2 family malate/lactate/ureidoglycolate dehydrogenase
VPTIEPDVLRDFVAAIYRAKGTPDSVAERVAQLQVDADLAGHVSHGVTNTPQYVAAIDRGHIRPDAPVEIVDRGVATAVIDGNWGFGYSVTTQATQVAISMARESGAAALVVRRQGHVGRLGAYTTKLAEAGLIGMLTADSGASTKIAVPFGGAEARLGSNPISIAVPGASRVVCFDVASTAVAAGKVMVARIAHKPVPTGWIVDSNGEPTTDPDDFVQGGALLPLGGDQGHKGYALSFVIEVLSGLLTGIGYGVDPSGRHNDGCFMAAFDISRFRDLTEFKNDVESFIDWIKATKLADGFTEILYPGEAEVRARERLLGSGIELHARVCDRLAKLAGELGVTVPGALITAQPR